jgi:hypothetical protein
MTNGATGGTHDHGISGELNHHDLTALIPAVRTRNGKFLANGLSAG